MTVITHHIDASGNLVLTLALVPGTNDVVWQGWITLPARAGAEWLDRYAAHAASIWGLDVRPSTPTLKR